MDQLGVIGARPEHLDVDLGVAQRAHPAERVSGDGFVAHRRPRGMVLAAFDGLGHGPEAREAAVTARRILTGHPTASVISLVRRCHEALLGLRGVTLSVATIDFVECTLTWLGVGNVGGAIWRSSFDAPVCHVIVNRGGIVGVRLPDLRAEVLPVAVDDMLIFATDGVAPDYVLHPPAPGVDATWFAEDLIARFGGGTDDALVLVARLIAAPGPGT